MRKTSYWYHDPDESIPVMMKLKQVVMNFIEFLQYNNFYILQKIFYLVDRRFNVSFPQGGTGVPCPPFSVSSAPLCCPLPALPLVVFGGGWLYEGD